jgi:lactoylglutathione lyase
MEFERNGVILNTENYDACVAFYRDVFDLPVMFETREGDFRLTCLDLGGSYLMIETEGVARPGGKTMAESATKLRFNVTDIEAARRHLAAHGIAAPVECNPWGATINLVDPDGNRIGIRDEQGFRAQLGGPGAGQ